MSRCESRQSPFQGPPNVILVSLDTVRADHLSLYGYYRPTTPELEILAEDAVVFERFYTSGGGTLPSHMSLFTSLYPYTHKVNPKERNALELERVTLAEQLRDAGYTIAAFTDAGWMRAKYGFYQGFDKYDEEGGRFETIMPKALGWLDGRDSAHAPFFLFIHSYDAHSEFDEQPYECPSSHRDFFTESMQVDFNGCRNGKCASRLLAEVNCAIRNEESTARGAFTAREIEFITARYDACIRYADFQVGLLIDHLQKRELYEHSMIIVLSDHGEDFAEHG